MHFEVPERSGVHSMGRPGEERRRGMMPFGILLVSRRKTDQGCLAEWPANKLQSNR